jgi:hypothetical protein
MTTGVFTVLGFVAKLKTIELEMQVLGPAIIAHACEMVAAEAKRVLGTEGYDWTPLAASTLAHKMQSGTVAKMFVAAVMARRREIEAAGSAHSKVGRKS